MLDPRLYRAAFVPVLLAIIVCAFSLQNRPPSIGTTLPPDAFDAEQAMAALTELGDRFPDRRPGGAGDEGLASEVAGRLRGLGGYSVRAERFSAATPDGRRELVNVVARRAGEPGPGLLVVAHRDSQAAGARAELSGTAALLELARVAADAQLERTITFASTSGGSAGATGARALVEQLGADPVAAVLVLGDMAGERVRKPFVVPWGDDRRRASLRLQRSVEAAVRLEAGVDPGGSRASAQLLRLALPGTVGEQGPLVTAGLPAVLLSGSGERPPRAGERVLERRLDVFGRAALRTITALDEGPSIERRTQRDVVVLRKVLPGWALRLLVLALLLPALVVTVDGLARANRRGEHVGHAVGWVVRAALPLLGVLVAARLLGLTGLLRFPPATLPGTALAVDTRAGAAFGLLALVAVLVLLVARPRGRFAGAGAGAVLGALLALTALATWVVSPAAALLLVPAVHLWLLLGGGLRRPVALLLVLLGVAPVVAAVGVRLAQLGVGPADAPAFLLGIAAGGHVGALSWPVWSLLAACVAGACALAWRSRPAPPASAGPSVRGPGGLAGPGALGGTASALPR